MNLLRAPIPILRCAPYDLYGCASRIDLGPLATIPSPLPGGHI
jgi:hypothetical protein